MTEQKITKIDTCGVVCTADEGRVEYLTQEGWRVIAVMAKVTAEAFYDEAPVADGYSTMQVKKYHPSTEVRFVLEKHPDSALAEMSADLEAARGRAADALNQLDQARDAGGVLQEKVGTLKLEVTELMEIRARLCDDLDSALGRVRAMESDLAKVREHFGAKAFAEALER